MAHQGPSPPHEARREGDPLTARLYKSESGLMLNMYDCTPCPRCGDTYRVPYQRGPVLLVECDECDHIEPWTKDNGRPAKETK